MSEKTVLPEGLVGKDVELIMLQISCSNFNIVPDGVMRAGPEPPAKKNLRKNDYIKGRQSIEPTSGVDVMSLLGDLEKVNYHLVGAICETRRKGGQLYPMIRFTFAPSSRANFSPDFLQVREKCAIGLQKIVENALWRVRAFVNPFFKDKVLVEGKSCLSINLEARQPLYDRGGKRILVWKKDEQGRRVGGCPVPIEPEFLLTIENGSLCLDSTALAINA